MTANDLTDALVSIGWTMGVDNRLVSPGPIGPYNRIYMDPEGAWREQGPLYYAFLVRYEDIPLTLATPGLGLAQHDLERWAISCSTSSNADWSSNVETTSR
jgi:hypothetical protein